MLSILMMGSLAAAQEAPPQLLHLGNSYTFQNDLPRRVVESMQRTVPAMDGVGTTVLAAGGLRLPDHVDRVERGDEQWTQALRGEPGRFDWVVMQDQSQIPGFTTSTSVYQESLAAVPILDSWAVEQAAESVLFMTWGRRDGDSTNPDLYPDFETMNARLDAGYQAYATQVSEAGRTIWIAPVGRAFGAVYDRLEREGRTPEDAGSDFHRLYSGDGSHPSPLGTALAAGVFVRALTGWTPDWSDPPVGVDEIDVEWMVAAVEAAVVPFGDLPYPWAISYSDYTAPSDVDADLGWVVSGPTLCATVGLAEAVDPVERLTVGAVHDGLAGCGRLWLLDGGTLTVDAVASESGATGALEVAGGELSVTTVEVPVSVSGGSFNLTGEATSSLQLSAGMLQLADGMTGADLTASGGTLSLSAGTADTPSVMFSGAVHLSGTLSISELGEGSAALLRASEVTLDDDLVHDLPEEWSLQVRDEDGMQVLLAELAIDGGEDSGAGGTSGDGSGDADGESDGSSDGSTDGSTDEADGGASGTADGDKSSGCAVAGSTLGGLGLALWLVAARRRD